MATGSVYVQPPIPGIENALSVRGVDAHEVETGENVVVCGGGITGLECALALAKYGSADVIMVGDCTARGGTYYRANHEAYYAAMRI